MKEFVENVTLAVAPALRMTCALLARQQTCFICQTEVDCATTAEKVAPPVHQPLPARSATTHSCTTPAARATCVAPTARRVPRPPSVSAASEPTCSSLGKHSAWTAALTVSSAASEKCVPNARHPRCSRIHKETASLVVSLVKVAPRKASVTSVSSLRCSQTPMVTASLVGRIVLDARISTLAMHALIPYISTTAKHKAVRRATLRANAAAT